MCGRRYWRARHRNACIRKPTRTGTNAEPFSPTSRSSIPCIGSCRAAPPPRVCRAFNPPRETLSGQDLALIRGLKGVRGEEDLRLVPKPPHAYVVLEPRGGYATAGEGRIVTEIPGSKLPRAIVFRDSFTSLLAPYLSEHFSRAVYLWQNNFDVNEVLKEHADVVIEDIVGPHLHNFIPSPELIPDP